MLFGCSLVFNLLIMSKLWDLNGHPGMTQNPATWYSDGYIHEVQPLVVHELPCVEVLNCTTLAHFSALRGHCQRCWMCLGMEGSSSVGTCLGL